MGFNQILVHNPLTCVSEVSNEHILLQQQPIKRMEERFYVTPPAFPEQWYEGIWSS